MSRNLVRLKKNGAYWQAWWTEHGKRKTKSLGAIKNLPRKDAQLICAGMTVRGQKPEPDSIDLGTWCDRYLDSREDELAIITYGIHKRTVHLLLMYFGAGFGITAISRADAANWRAKLANKMNISDQTVCKYVRTAKVIFKHAADQDLVEFNPFDRLRGTPAKVEREHIEVNEFALGLMLKSEDFHPLSRLWIALCYYAGLRRMEAYRLRWCDVKLAERKIIINAAGGSMTSKHKLREVRMEPALYEVLLWAYNCDLMTGNEPSPRLLRYLPADYKVNRDLRTGLGDDRLTLQQLRRCRDTIWHQQFPAYVCASWLGHTEQTAMKHYLTVPQELFTKEV